MTKLILLLTFFFPPLVSSAGVFKIPQDENVLISFGKVKNPLKRLNPDSISILSWNAFRGKRPSFSKSYNSLSKGKDLIFVQEALLAPPMKNVFAKDKTRIYQTATSFIFDNEATGVTTASRTSPLFSFWIRSSVTEPLTRTPKMILLSSYKVEGSDHIVLTANIHALNFVSRKNFEVMLFQLEEELLKHRGPIILVGDFNTWTKGKALSLLGMTKRLSLKEVVFKKDLRLKFFGLPLDYIFTRDFETLYSKVHKVKTSSDHNALEAKLRLIK